MTIFLWIFTALIFYVYLGYPFIVWVSSLIFYKGVRRKSYEPTVSVILSAFNEEKHIEAKLRNLLSLDYPTHKIEIIVGSDGASDKTDLIVSRFKSRRIRFFRFVSNLGKPNVLNSLVREAHGEILIFTDARQEFENNAIRMLCENFYDQNVGCVSGELLFKSVKEGVSKGMDIYWRYEKFLRRCESNVGSMLGATGAIYAIRRHLFTDIPAHILVDDMYIPLSIIRKGHRAIFDPLAIAYDEISGKGYEEFKRKVRTLAGNYQMFQCYPDLLIPFKSPIGGQFISHKLLRVLVPFFLMGLFAANVFAIEYTLYRVTLLAQIVFYALATLGAYEDKKSRVSSDPLRHLKGRGIGYIPYTFCLLNYAALMGLIRYLVRKKSGVWEKAYA